MRAAIILPWLALALAGCATTTVTAPLPATNVPAMAETDPVGTAARDAADDPAIWRNTADPMASLVVGTDKRAGIYVYGLDGLTRSFVAAGEVNNVDLRGDVQLGGRAIILVGASNRNSLTEPRLSLFTLDGANGQLAALASFATGASGEAYGFCFGWHIPGLPLAYIVTKQGNVLEFILSEDRQGVLAIRLARQFGVATQTEGCVVDDRTGQLYLGEEDVGIWRFDLTAVTPVAIPFATVGAQDGLVADVEGLALAPEGTTGGMLVASSQGDNAYVLFDLGTGMVRGRFRIEGGAIDGTVDTDGIEMVPGDFGARYPDGLFIAQDGNNLPDAQNFKYLSWRSVREALGMGPTPR